MGNKSEMSFRRANVTQAEILGPCPITAEFEGMLAYRVLHKDDKRIAAYFGAELCPIASLRVGQSIKTIDLRDNSDFYVDGEVGIEAAWVQNRQPQSEGVIVKRLPRNNSLYVVVHQPGEIEAIYYETEIEALAKVAVPEVVILAMQKRIYVCADGLKAQSDHVLETRKEYRAALADCMETYREITQIAAFLDKVSPDAVKGTWAEELALGPMERWLKEHGEAAGK
jgi:hypothetical protein